MKPQRYWIETNECCFNPLLRCPILFPVPSILETQNQRQTPKLQISIEELARTNYSWTSTASLSAFVPSSLSLWVTRWEQGEETRNVNYSRLVVFPPFIRKQLLSSLLYTGRERENGASETDRQTDTARLDGQRKKRRGERKTEHVQVQTKLESLYLFKFLPSLSLFHYLFIYYLKTIKILKNSNSQR